MIGKIISLFLNAPKIVRIKVYPYFNRLLIKKVGGHLGNNIQIPGKLNLKNQGSFYIGDNFYFSSGDSVNPIASNLQGNIYIEPKAHLKIGNNVGMSSTRIWCSNSIIIGNYAKIGACVLITDTDAHPMDYLIRRSSGEGTQSAPIFIEDDVWIGAHSIILKGVTIGARSIIGAGSVVTKSIPADCVAAGNPCKVIRKLNNAINE